MKMNTRKEMKRCGALTMPKMIGILTFLLCFESCIGMQLPDDVGAGGDGSQNEREVVSRRPSQHQSGQDQLLSGGLTGHEQLLGAGAYQSMPPMHDEVETDDRLKPAEVPSSGAEEVTAAKHACTVCGGCTDDSHQKKNAEDDDYEVMEESQARSSVKDRTSSRSTTASQRTDLTLSFEGLDVRPVRARSDAIHYEGEEEATCTLAFKCRCRNNEIAAAVGGTILAGAGSLLVFQVACTDLLKLPGQFAEQATRDLGGNAFFWSLLVIVLLSFGLLLGFAFGNNHHAFTFGLVTSLAIISASTLAAIPIACMTAKTPIPIGTPSIIGMAVAGAFMITMIVIARCLCKHEKVRCGK